MSEGTGKCGIGLLIVLHWNACVDYCLGRAEAESVGEGALSYFQYTSTEPVQFVLVSQKVLVLGMSRDGLGGRGASVATSRLQSLA